MPDYPFDIFLKVIFGSTDQPAQVNILGGDPKRFAGNPMRLRVAFFETDGVTLANSSVVQMQSCRAYIEAAERDNVELASSPPVSAFNSTLTAADWNNGVDQHVILYFTAAQMELAVAAGPGATAYFLGIGGTSLDQNSVVQPDTFGFANLQMFNDGYTDGQLPTQPGNSVGNGATYDGSGHYVLAVTPGRYYIVAFGAHDISITNVSAGDVTASLTVFAAHASTITLNGTPGATVTAVVRPNPVATTDLLTAVILGSVGNIFANGIWVKNPIDNLFYKSNPTTVQGVITWLVDETSGTGTPS